MCYFVKWLINPIASVCPVCCVELLSCVRHFATTWTVSTRLLCPWGFFRQKHWSGLPHPPPGDLPNPGIQSRSPSLQEDSLPSEPPRKHTMQKATLSKYRYKFIPDLGSVSSSYKHLPWEIGLENREIWRHLNTPLGQP